MQHGEKKGLCYYDQTIEDIIFSSVFLVELRGVAQLTWWLNLPHSPLSTGGGGGENFHYVCILGISCICAARETPIFSPKYPVRSISFSHVKIFRSGASPFYSFFAVPETIIFEIPLRSIPGGPPKNGTVDFQDFALNNSYLFSPCWIEHLFLITITPRSSNLVENYLFYE